MRRVGLASHARARGDVHDGAARARQQVRERGLHRVERAGEVHGQHPLPLLLVDLLEPGGAADAGRVHQDVDAAEGADRRVHRGAHGRHRADVADGAVRDAAGRADRRHRLGEAGAVHVDAEDLGALGGEEPRGRPTEARAGAGDEEDPPQEPHRAHASSTRPAVVIVASNRSVCSKTASTYSSGVPVTASRGMTTW